MEGIETNTLECWSRLRKAVSVGAPTWRGLKRVVVLEHSFGPQGVSRCPDMEGIETGKALGADPR